MGRGCGTCSCRKIHHPEKRHPDRTRTHPPLLEAGKRDSQAKTVNPSQGEKVEFLEHTSRTLVQDAIEDILRTRNTICADAPLEWPFLPPLEMATAVGNKRRNPLPAPSAKALGVLGSPTGHPFFIVDGDNNKARPWHSLGHASDRGESDADG